MAVEGSSIFTTESEDDIPENGGVSINDSLPSSGMADPGKRKVENSGHEGKRRRGDEPETNGQSYDFQKAFLKMWDRSIQEGKDRFERSAEIFREAQNKQLEQTNAILAGFKDIYEDLASK